MFVHHVFFWLKNAKNEADTSALVAGLETLKAIPGYHTAIIGKPAATNRPVIDTSYDVSWLLLFETAEQEAIYQDHPIHQTFIANCAALWERVVVYDAV
jgi:Stress responsive A/B Barrel Domain